MTRNMMLASAAVVALHSNASDAAIIAGYDFTTNADPTLTATGVLASSVTGNDGFSNAGVATVIGDTTGFAASGTAFGSELTGSFGDTNQGLQAQSFSASVSNGEYMTFTVTADVPGTLNLTAFSVSTARAGVRAPESYNIIAQVNSGTTWNVVDALTSSQTTTVSQATPEWFDTYVDLSSDPTFQGIDSVEFRIYFWGASGNSSSSRVNIDNLLLEGEISPVPEPTTNGVLLGIGTVSLLLRRRARA